MIVTRQWELRNTSSRAYLIQCKSLSLMKTWEMMKAVMSIYFTFLFIPVQKRVQAPNDTNSEMKAANLIVSDTELWCLTAHCLLRFLTWRSTLAFYSGGAEENNVSDLWFIITNLKDKWDNLYSLLIKVSLM